MTGIRHERTEQHAGSDFVSQRRLGASLSKSFERRAALGGEAEGQSATKTAARSGGRSDPCRRPFGLVFPWVQTTLNTVSTDDAYVNGHVTFVAARVRGQVARVLVDDNYRVRKGDLLVQLDKEPFQIAVAIKKAAVDTATADLQVAKSKVRGIEAEAMSRRRALQHAMEDVDNQVALLRTRLPVSTRAKPSSRWLRLTSTAPRNWW